MENPRSQFQSLLQNPQKHQLDPFVAGFLRIWIKVHDMTTDATLDDIYDLSKRTLEESVLPFYHKFKQDPSLQIVEPWLKSYASIIIRWRNGSHLIPHLLIVYELCHRSTSILHALLQGLKTGQIPGKKEALFELLFPVLNNYVAPLDNIDIGILRANLHLERNPKNWFRDFSNKDYARFLGKSIKTVYRRTKRIKLLDVVSAVHFLDMGQLGYETSLLFHPNRFPGGFMDNLLMNSIMPMGTFSLVQIPCRNTTRLQALQEALRESQVFPMTRRVVNWNLTGLAGGNDPWQIPPSLVYSDPHVGITNPSPRLDFSLVPHFQSFQLTSADIKILDFLSTTGDFATLGQLSKAVDVSTATISHRLQEYTRSKLIVKSCQFFNLGLDITIFFYLSMEGATIPCLDHFLTFPKADVLSHEEASIQRHFGFLKLPNKCIKPFARNMDQILEAQQDANMRFYWKIVTGRDHFKWGLSLQKTYSGYDSEVGNRGS